MQSETTENVMFDLLDNRNRQVGCLIYRWNGTGGTFIFRPHASRDAIAYGACQNDRAFSTEEKREQAIASYLKSATARMRRKFGK